MFTQTALILNLACLVIITWQNDLFKDICILLLSFQNWEILILNRLRWDINAVLPNDFLEYLFAHLELPECLEKDEDIRKPTLTYIAICCTGKQSSLLYFN